MKNPQSIILLILAAAAVFAAVYAAIRLLSRRRAEELRSRVGTDFEKYCAAILEDAGFENVRLTRASGDYGVDLLAEKDWITWAFQCKCYDGPVGIKAVQEIYSGRDFYHCHVGVVMTNSIFTSAAENLAQSQNILLWDGDFLQTLAGEER